MTQKTAKRVLEVVSNMPNEFRCKDWLKHFPYCYLKLFATKTDLGYWVKKPVSIEDFPDHKKWGKKSLDKKLE